MQLPEVFYKKALLKISQNLQENTCARVSILIKFQASAWKETLAHVFSCEFCETFKNTFFIKYLQRTASECSYLYKNLFI